MIFVDTNYFLRFLLKDIDNQHEKAKNLFQAGALGQQKIFTSLVVFFEVYWVLSAFYGRNKGELVKILSDILQMDFVKISNKKWLEKAIEIYDQTSLDLEDAFNLVYAKEHKANSLATFDRVLERVFKTL